MVKREMDGYWTWRIKERAWSLEYFSKSSHRLEQIYLHSSSFFMSSDQGTKWSLVYGTEPWLLTHMGPLEACSRQRAAVTGMCHTGVPWDGLWGTWGREVRHSSCRCGSGCSQRYSPFPTPLSFLICRHFVTHLLSKVCCLLRFITTG